MSEPDDRDRATTRHPRIPRRLLDEPEGLPDDLVKGLQALRDRRPSAARLAVIAVPFGLSSSAATDALASGSSTAAAPTSSAAVLAKILGAMVAAGGVGLLVWAGARDQAARSEHPPRGAESVAAVPARAAGNETATRTAPSAPAARRTPPVTTSEGSLNNPEPTIVSGGLPPPSSKAPSPIEQRDASLMPRTTDHPRTGPKPIAQPTSSPTPRTYVRPSQGTEEAQLSETELLAQARSAEPARALALAEEHARRFPASPFAQEREYLIITALVRAGNRSAAEQRARQFARSYPKSAYMARLQSLVPGAFGGD